MSVQSSSKTPQAENKDDIEPMETNNTAPTSDGPATDHDLFKHFFSDEGQDQLEEKLEAFRHNCELKVKEDAPRFSGCHNLDCFLQAVASGVVLASVDKLPGDGLPNGVYQFQMSCRKDLPTPNFTPNTRENTKKKDLPTPNTKEKDLPTTVPPVQSLCPRHEMLPEKCRDKDSRIAVLTRKDKACAGTMDFRYSPYTKRNENEKPTYVECPVPLKHQLGDKTQLGEIKFKLKPQVKTVFNPAIWTKEDLADKCNKAFKHAVDGTEGGKLYDKKKRWSGPFTDDNGDTYWMEGFYKTVEKKTKIRTFNFVHTDILKKNPEHRKTVFTSSPKTN